MGLMSIFDISGSAMSAQSVRLNATASNLANANSAARSADEVYRARHPVFASVQAGVNETTSAFDWNSDSMARRGVQVLGITESEAPLQPRFEPEHPLADEDGYVFYPNVNVVEEMTDMISSSRSFQANVDVMSAARTMMQRVLSMGQ